MKQITDTVKISSKDDNCVKLCGVILYDSFYTSVSLEICANVVIEKYY